MHIVTIVAGGDGLLRIAATRAPDLFRRQIAAATGDAYLVYCCVAPQQIGARLFVERLRQTLSRSQQGSAGFALSPKVAIRAVHRLIAIARLQRDLRALRRVLGRLMAR